MPAFRFAEKFLGSFVVLLFSQLGSVQGMLIVSIPRSRRRSGSVSRMASTSQANELSTEVSGYRAYIPACLRKLSLTLPIMLLYHYLLEGAKHVRPHTSHRDCDGPAAPELAEPTCYSSGSSPGKTTEAQIFSQ